MSVAIWEVDYDDAGRILEPYVPVLQRLIANAIATERERCAQIAECHNAAGKAIAHIIRQPPS